MSYKSSKSTGGKASSTTKSSLKGTKTVTKVSSAGSSTSVSSSGGTSTGGGITNIVDNAQQLSPTKPNGNVRNVSEPNYYPARHFYVTAGASRTPTVTVLALSLIHI